MANIIERIGKPTLLMSHNKTLAAQLYSELKSFFPDNAVEYFVSYFDYYQPEAYIPRSDTYIEKDSSVNDEIERLRLSTMGSLITREDVIVVASVSCIYGLGSPEDYQNMMLPVKTGDQLDREEFLAGLVSLMFERNDIAFSRGQFRVRGDVVEVHPAYLEDTAIRVEFFGDEVERISEIDALTGNRIDILDSHTFFPAKQFVTDKDKLNQAIHDIKKECAERVSWFEEKGKLIEAQRIRMRTDFDIEMMQEMGFCQGIENYSRHLTGRDPGARPYTLLDFFPDDFLMIVDESHVSVPQVGAMYGGDRSRKVNLVEYGFRLPAAMDNRPLKFEEFETINNQIKLKDGIDVRYGTEAISAVVQKTDTVEALAKKYYTTEDVIRKALGNNTIEAKLDTIDAINQSRNFEIEQVSLDTITDPNERTLALDEIEANGIEQGLANFSKTY